MDDFLNLQQDINHLDTKMDKLEENTNKRLEKIEDNMIKFTENTGNAINKVTEAIVEMKLAIVRDGVVKSDLEKLENKLEANNKEELKKVDNRLSTIEKGNSLSLPEMGKKILYAAGGGAATFVASKFLGS